jgi:hypothetical protein
VQAAYVRHDDHSCPDRRAGPGAMREQSVAIGRGEAQVGAGSDLALQGWGRCAAVVVVTHASYLAWGRGRRVPPLAKCAARVRALRVQ